MFFHYRMGRKKFGGHFSLDYQAPPFNPRVFDMTHRRPRRGCEPRSRGRLVKRDLVSRDLNLVCGSDRTKG